MGIRGSARMNKVSHHVVLELSSQCFLICCGGDSTKAIQINELGNQKQVINQIQRVVQDHSNRCTGSCHMKDLESVKLPRPFNVEHSNKFYA